MMPQQAQADLNVGCLLCVCRNYDSYVMSTDHWWVDVLCMLSWHCLSVWCLGTLLHLQCSSTSLGVLLLGALLEGQDPCHAVKPVGSVGA